MAQSTSPRTLVMPACNILHVAQDRLPLRQGGPAALDCLRMQPQVRAKEKSAVAWMIRRTIRRRVGIHRPFVAQPPLDDLVAATLDFLARGWQRRRRGQGCGQPFDDQVFDGRIVFQRRQDFDLNLRKPLATLGQQGGDVVRHVLPGIKKVRHDRDAPDATGSQLGHPVGNVRAARSKKKSSGRFPAPAARQFAQPRWRSLRWPPRAGCRDRRSELPCRDSYSYHLTLSRSILHPAQRARKWATARGREAQWRWT